MLWLVNNNFHRILNETLVAQVVLDHTQSVWGSPENLRIVRI